MLSLKNSLSPARTGRRCGARRGQNSPDDAADHPLRELNALRNLKTVKSLGLTVPPGLLGCCARAANGHAAAAPPRSVMNWRRFTR
jgi:hypothetical protein